MSLSLKRANDVLRGSQASRLTSIFRSGLVLGAGLVVALAMLVLSHGLAFKSPVVLVFILLMIVPALVTAAAPAAGLGLLLLVSLISWDVPALSPPLAALGPESTFAIALLTASAGLLLRAYFQRERLTATPLFRPLLVCGAWVLVSFAWNFWRGPTDRSILITGLKGLATIVVFFLFAANAVRTEQALKRILLTIVFASIPLSLVAYLQYGWLYQGVDYSAIHPALQRLAENVTFGARVAGPLSEATILSFYYLGVAVLAIGLLLLERSWRLRVALLITLAIDLWPFVLTFTKSTTIAAVFALLALAWFRRSWVIAGSAVALAGLNVVLLSFVPRLADMAVHAVSYGTTSDIAQRTTLLKQCAAAIPSHALFGLGPLGSQTITTLNCHDLPLELLVDYGVIGAALFGWVIWRVFVLSWRLPRRPSNTLAATFAQMNLALLLAFGALALLWSLVNFGLPWLWCIVGVAVGGRLFGASSQQPMAQNAAPTLADGGASIYVEGDPSTADQQSEKFPKGTLSR